MQRQKLHPKSSRALSERIKPPKRALHSGTATSQVHLQPGSPPSSHAQCLYPLAHCSNLAHFNSQGSLWKQLTKIVQFKSSLYSSCRTDEQSYALSCIFSPSSQVSRHKDEIILNTFTGKHHPIIQLCN